MNPVDKNYQLLITPKLKIAQLWKTKLKSWLLGK